MGTAEDMSRTEEVYEIWADCTGSRMVFYDMYETRQVIEAVHAVDPARTRQVAEAWEDMASRLDEVARVVSRTADGAYQAWQGGKASVDCQRSLYKMHATAKGLAGNARAMGQMVWRLANAQKTAQEAAQDAEKNMRPDDHGAARQALRDFHQAYEDAMRVEGPNFIAVNHPTINVDRDTESPRHLVPPGGAPSGSAYLPSGGAPGGPSSGWSSPGSDMRQWDSAVTDPVSPSHPSSVSPVSPGPSWSPDQPNPDGIIGGYDDVPSVDGSTSDETRLAGFHPSGSGGGGAFDWSGTGSGTVGGHTSSGYSGAGGSPGGGGGSGYGGGYGAGSGTAGSSGFGSGGTGAARGVPGRTGPGGMMPPMAPAGQGQDEEHERSVWMSEEDDVWGVELPPVSGVIGAPEEDERPSRRRRQWE